MNYIDYKCTTWNRINLPDDVKLEDVEKMIKDGLTINEIIEELDNMNLSWQFLTDLEEFITPEDNYGQATMELYSNDYDLICNNEIKS